MKTKITHIIYSGFGGTTDYVFNLVRGDAEKKYEHSIIFYGIEEPAEETVAYANTICSRTGVIIKKQGRDKTAMEQLEKITRQLNPAFVTLHINSLILEVRHWLPSSTRLIFVEHQAHHLKAKKEWIYSVLAQRRAKCVVSLTAEAQKSLRQKIRFLYSASKNKVIRSGIAAIDYHSERGITDKIKIGMVGRMNKFRDHETLIKSFLSLNIPGAELHLAGDGPLFSELLENYSSDTVFFHGLLNSKEIIRFLGDMTIYVQASHGETSSIALLQAQAARLPVIASDVAGISNVLHTGNALLVASANVDQLAAAMKKMIADHELRKQLSAAGYNEVTQYGNNEMFAAYQELFQ